MQDDRTLHGWTAAQVGCYWSRGLFHVCTSTRVDGPGCYVVFRDRQLLAEVDTWEEVDRLTDRRKGPITPSEPTIAQVRAVRALADRREAEIRARAVIEPELPCA